MADKTFSIYDIENYSFDQENLKKMVELIGFDGTNLQRLLASNLATKITTSGSIVYIGVAAPGTPQSTDKWICKKIDSTDPNNVLITWADSGNPSQTSTDLTANSYA